MTDQIITIDDKKYKLVEIKEHNNPILEKNAFSIELCTQLGEPHYLAIYYKGTMIAWFDMYWIDKKGKLRVVSKFYHDETDKTVGLECIDWKKVAQIEG